MKRFRALLSFGLVLIVSSVAHAELYYFQFDSTAKAPTPCASTPEKDYETWRAAVERDAAKSNAKCSKSDEKFDFSLTCKMSESQSYILVAQKTMADCQFAAEQFKNEAKITDHEEWNEATTFLKKIGCDFAAFRIYTGKTNKRYGLINGHVLDRAICVTTFETSGFKKQYVCAARAIDLLSGRYADNPTRGSVHRREGKPCSLDVLKDIYKKGSLPYGEVQVGNGPNSRWEVAVDNFGFTEIFQKILNHK